MCAKTRLARQLGENTIRGVIMYAYITMIIVRRFREWTCDEVIDLSPWPDSLSLATRGPLFFCVSRGGNPFSFPLHCTIIHPLFLIDAASPPAAANADCEFVASLILQFDTYKDAYAND